MNFSDLQLRAATLASYDGWVNTVPAPDWATLVNRAWRRFSWEGEILSGKMSSTTVIGQSSYPLTPSMKRVLDVRMGTTMLFGSNQDFERFLSPGWRFTQGSPIRFVQESVNSVAFVPVPSAATAFDVYGVIEGSDMTATTDLPGQVGGVGNPVPVNLHEAIALLAAVLQGEIAMQGESSSRMTSYVNQYQAYVQDCLSVNGRKELPVQAVTQS